MSRPGVVLRMRVRWVRCGRRVEGNGGGGCFEGGGGREGFGKGGFSEEEEGVVIVGCDIGVGGFEVESRRRGVVVGEVGDGSW